LKISAVSVADGHQRWSFDQRCGLAILAELITFDPLAPVA